ncbi:OprO/OprP family phosphate-selective porin [Coralloluteibacterium stylophorae]|uniref:Porin n=1 Tax=Coralloluteibacterium stylophorae TaxID=1776034 RepID=A0A8J7VUG2_9GAMM|nr:porin [Coralloluteibacterium stylophorae]MBS7458933.1 porin [Coralloluteibacterium stylophorae]
MLRLCLPWLFVLAFPFAARADILLSRVGDHEVSFNGFIQSDANWFDEDVAVLTTGDDSRETRLRRAELVLEGESEHWGWTVGYDPDRPQFLDVRVDVDAGPGELRIGQFKHYNSLEELSSTRENDFIAKAIVTETFGIARRLGVGWQGSAGAWTFAGSGFGRELTEDSATGNGGSLRVTWAPLQTEGHLLHVGASLLQFNADGDSIRVRARPQADLAAARLVDTGELVAADYQRVFGLEAMYVRGALKLQSELMLAEVARDGLPDFRSSSGYLSALWTLTGQSWGYRGAVPRTPRPEAWDAMWQLGLRYDAIDLDDGAVDGGEMDTVTAGVNCYLSEHLKLAVNYVDVHSRRAGIDDDPDVVEARLQLHW